jgi:hypothetical protein
MVFGTIKSLRERYRREPFHYYVYTVSFNGNYDDGEYTVISLEIASADKCRKPAADAPKSAAVKPQVEVDSRLWHFKITNSGEIKVFSPANQAILNSNYAKDYKGEFKVVEDTPTKKQSRLYINFSNPNITFKTTGLKDDNNYAELLRPSNKSQHSEASIVVKVFKL